MAERITCPICGYGKAVHYDYDQGGPGKAQRTGIYRSDQLDNLRPLCAPCHRDRQQNDTVQLHIA